MNAIAQSNKLYEITTRLLASHGHLFVKVEPHEEADPDGSDMLWLSVEEDDMSEGHLIGLSPLSEGRWYADHDCANKYGGWPTVWSFHGTEDKVIEAVVAYLADLKNR